MDTLLPHGLSILGGAPKVGKSWLVLDLCVHIAKGEPIWNLPTQQSAVLYLCLEDSEKRVQQRLLTARAVSDHSGLSVSPKGLKQMMNKWQSRLEREGVRFRSYQSNGRQLVELLFASVMDSGASDVSGAENAGGKFFVPCVSCVPADDEAEGIA